MIPDYISDYFCENHLISQPTINKNQTSEQVLTNVFQQLESTNGNSLLVQNNYALIEPSSLSENMQRKPKTNPLSVQNNYTLIDPKSLPENMQRKSEEIAGHGNRLAQTANVSPNIWNFVLLAPSIRPHNPI